MTRQTYYCTASDWHFARAYSFAAVPGEQAAEPKAGRGWFWPPLLLFVLCAIGSVIHMHWLWFAGIVASFPLFLFMYQRNNSREYAALAKRYEFATSSARVVPYVSLDGHTLQCHFFRPDQSVSHQIKLEHIHGMAMSTLSRSVKTLRLPAMINQRARELGGEVVPEKLNDNQTYQLWIYTKTPMLYRSCILVPAGWFKDATFASFISELQQNSGIKVDLDPFIPSDAPVLRYLQQYSIDTQERRR